MKDKVLKESLENIDNKLEIISLFEGLFLMVAIGIGFLIFFLFQHIKGIEFDLEEIKQPYETENYCVKYYNETGYVLSKCEIFKDKLLEIKEVKENVKNNE